MGSELGSQAGDLKGVAPWSLLPTRLHTWRLRCAERQERGPQGAHGGKNALWPLELDSLDPRAAPALSLHPRTSMATLADATQNPSHHNDLGSPSR